MGVYDLDSPQVKRQERHHPFMQYIMGPKHASEVARSDGQSHTVEDFWRTSVARKWGVTLFHDDAHRVGSAVLHQTPSHTSAAKLALKLTGPLFSLKNISARVHGQ